MFFVVSVKVLEVGNAGYSCGARVLHFRAGRAFLEAMNHRQLWRALLRAAYILPLAALLTPQWISAQRSTAQDSLTQVLGATYEAGALRHFLLGTHWRQAWTTPVTVPLMDIDSVAGGLTPLRSGVEVASHALFLRAADGRLFRYSVINRDPATAWRPDIRRAVVTRTMRDQITTMLPFAPVVAAALDRRAGLDVPQPRPVALRGHPELNDWPRFTGETGMLEQEPPAPLAIPGDGPTPYDGPDPAWASTYTMLTLIETHGDHRVDARQFCRARLMDVLLGDWSRDADQWLWHARYEKNLTVWEPLPRGREQAFSLFDGLIPSVVELLVRPLQSYDTPEPNLKSLTWTARHLDRRLLAALPASAWDDVARDIQTRLSDAAVDSALLRLPAALRAAVVPQLRRLILQRRDRLPALAGEFYRLLARVVDVYGSVEGDSITVLRDVGGALHVRVNAPGDAWHYERRFLRDETGEVRIHARAGDDTVCVSGEADASIDLRVVAGAGSDVLIDRSWVHGCFLRVTPFPRAEHVTWFYDDDIPDTVILGPGTTFDGRATLPPASSADRFEPLVEDRGTALRFDHRFTFNSDDGFIVGGGPVFTRYGFRKDPYAWRVAASAAYATTLGDVLLQSDILYASSMPGVLLHLSLFHSEMSQSRFYGFGNETIRDAVLEDRDYYLLRQESVDIRPAIRFTPSADLSFEMGGAYRYSEVSEEANTLLRKEDLYGENRFEYGEIFGDIIWDRRDNARIPMRGSFIRLSGMYFPVMLTNRHHFADGMLDLRAYLPMSDDVTLALRGMGRNIWGRYPFFHAAYLGGKYALRGYTRERFAGDAAVLGSVELRASCGGLRIFLPGEWGITAFTDAGRVFVEGEHSRRIHAGVGGGLWIAALNRRLALNVQAALSRERLAFYVGTGFSF